MKSNAQKAAGVPPRPRTKPAGVRRDELMDAAEGLFIKNGVAATSVDDIVALADVAKGTFYLHFASKDGLLAALQQRFVSRAHESLLRAINRRHEGDWVGRLDAWVETSIGGYIDHADLHHVVFHEFTSDPKEPAHDNRVVEELARLLAAGVQAGAFKTEDAVITATMLFHALHGLAHDSATGKRPNRQRLILRGKEFFRRAVEA
jgi:AcrR family transcriptional regulator